ncbi:MAG: glycosyltransferase [Desulfobacterales bacterium]|jgi:hypothetical protein
MCTKPISDRIEKRVLYISYSFPPSGGSAVQRPLKFTKFLSDFGWKVHVVSVKKDYFLFDFELRKEIPDKTSVTEAFSLEPSILKIILKRKYKKFYRWKFASLIMNFFLKIYSVIFYRLVIIDWCDGWVPFGFLKAKKIMRKENVDLILVSMEPSSACIIGILLKKITGKPLVLDYHDAWTTSVPFGQRNGLRKKISEMLENYVINFADKIIACKTDIIFDIQRKFGSLDDQKFVLIRNGYDADDYSGVKKKENKKFVITYTGKLSEKLYYSPETFINALSQFIRENQIPKNDICVLFVGLISKNYKNRFAELIKKLNIEDIVITTGNVDHTKCIEYQKNSDLLLYIIESIDGKKASYKFSGVIPAKIYEYIYSGTPILAIAPPGFEVDLINKTKTGFVAEPNNIKSVKKVLFKIYKKYKSGQLFIDPNMEEIRKYDRRELTKKLAGVLDEVVSHSN